MKLKIIMLLCFLSQIAFSQAIVKRSIDNGGAFVSTQSISLIYTIGEVNVQENTVGEISISEGFISSGIINPITYVPDDNFEKELIRLGYDDSEDDYVLTSNISGVTSLYLSSKEIADLTGIEDFTSLTYLDCRFNQLDELDISQNTALTTLMCAGNQLSTLDLTQNTALTYVLCSNNRITDLNVSQCTGLKNLYCSNNNLAHLNVSANTALLRLDCGMNQLTEIDITSNTALQEFYCHSNQLDVLNLNSNTHLRKLTCENNQLTELNISNNLLLYMLNCGKNKLTSLNVRAHHKLEELQCHYNQLTELDVSQNPYLTKLLCFVNDLVYLDVRNGANENMETFSTFSNKLSCVDVDDELADHSAWNVDAGVIFSNDCGYNTQRGDEVKVYVGEPMLTAVVTYNKVDRSGETSLSISSEDIQVSDGFETLEPSTVYDITTTASYTGKIIIELDYSGFVVENESALRMLHFEEGVWVDITKAVLTEEDILVGVTSSLSPFVMALDIQPPELILPANISVNNDPDICGAVVLFESPTAEDNCGIASIVQTDDTGLQSGSLFPVGTTTLTYEATDISGHITNGSFDITVINTEPEIITLDAPVKPVMLGEPITATASFLDDNVVSATIDWGDGTIIQPSISGAVISETYTYVAAGVYVIELFIEDACGAVATRAFEYAVMYDPSDGFVTGGGWIYSPPDAYIPDPTLEGKANFGFVSKYKKGATVPTGNTEFQFKAADFNFNSDVYEWLVVAGPQAKFKGDGSVNGVPGYGFMVSAVDGQVNGGGGLDKFRIKIWDKSIIDEPVVYDNQPGEDEDATPATVISGGSITIHDGKDKNARIAYIGDNTELDLNQQINIYPNPVREIVTVEFPSEYILNDEPIEIHLFSLTGVDVMENHIITVKDNMLELDLMELPSGIYILSLPFGDKTIQHKITKL